MRGKTIVITGGNRGIGRQTAELLAREGHRVIFTSRDPDKGEAAAAEIRSAVANASVEMEVLDLASLASVRAFGRRCCSREQPIDALVHNAGVMQTSPTRRETADGFEETLGVNALAPMLLTRELMPALAMAPTARIVSLTSRLHAPDTRGQPVDFDFEDPQLLRGYNPDRAYKNSKLAVLWFAYELQRRLEGRPITSNAVCPGFVPRTAAASAKGFTRFLLRHVLHHMSFTKSPEQAAASIAWMVTDPSLEGTGGGFYGEMQPQRSSDESYDEAKAERFWQLACELVGIQPDWLSATKRRGHGDVVGG